MITTQDFVLRMNPIAPAPLRLHSEIDELSKLTAYIEAFAEKHGVSMADTMAFTLAAEELFANTVHYSQTPVTFIEFLLVSNGDSLIATYTDNASAFDPTQQATPDTTLGINDRGVGGLGIHLIRRTMEIFRYERAGECNVVTFGRRRND